jgi:hypothetical protein
MIIQKNTFIFAILFLLFSFGLVHAQISETDLLKKPLIETKADALQNTQEVYRLKIKDYNSKQDDNFLKQFVNCQSLSFSANSQVDVIPLGMNKMVQLQYLDISETTIKTVTLFTKKNKLLKLVYTKAGQLDDSEKKTLSKRGITLIESPANLPVVFSSSESNVTIPATNTSANTATNTNSTSTYSPAGNVNTFIGPIPASKLTKSAAGEWVANPDNVEIDWNKRSWDVQQNGKKVAYVKTEQYAILDQNGNPIALVPFMEVSIDLNTAFSNGMIPFQDRKSKKYGYLDNNGKIAITAQFDKTFPFVNGTAVAEKDGLSIYIDKTGKIILSGDFKETIPFYHPKYAVVKYKGDTKHSIINNEGKIVSKNIWSDDDIKFEGDLTVQEVFNAGMLRSYTGTGINVLYGYKDLAGNWVVKPQYKDASHFIAGMAKVTGANLLKLKSGKKLDLSGIINTKGELVFPLEYKILSEPWYNTLGGEITIAGEHKDKGFMIMNTKGELLLGPFHKYGNKQGPIYSLTPFKNNYAIIEYYPNRAVKDRHYSAMRSSVCDIIDEKGKVVLKEFEYIINYPVNEFGVFGFTNSQPPNIYTMLFAEAKVDTTIKMKNGLAKLNGDIIEIAANSVISPLASKKNGLIVGSYNGFEAYMIVDPYMISNSGKYFELKRAVINQKIADGVDHLYLANGKEIDESFKGIGINSLRIKSELEHENLVSYTKKLQTNSETGLYDRWQQKTVFTFPPGKQMIGFFSENRVVISSAGWVIEKLDLKKLGIE